MKRRSAAARTANAGVRVDNAKTFAKSAAGSSGRWAGERLLAAVNAGVPLSPQVLRTLDTLRKNEWEHLDEALVQEGIIRLRGIAWLISSGLTIPVPNAMGKTMFQWEDVTDMQPAETSLSGVTRTEDDRVDFDLNQQPLPITHKDFNLNLRTLAASRERGEPLDTMQAGIAGRLVAEQLEKMMFQGGRTFAGSPIYGLTTHPDRNLGSFGSGNWAGGGVTGEQILADVLNYKAALEADRMYGPYALFIPSNFNTKLDNDFKANSDLTIRQRLLQVDGLQSINTVDQMPASNVVMLQATRDVVALVDGEPLQSVQWDIEGGFIIKFKAFAIQVPLVRSDAAGRSGVVHAS